MKGKSGWYHLIALGVVTVWGLTFISTKLCLMEGLTPADIFFYRFLIAYVLIWFFGTKRLLAKSWRDELLFLLLGISGGSAYFLTENTALNYTLTSNVALLVCTAPLITAIFSHFFLKEERLTKRVGQGSLIALLGAGLVIFNGHFILKLSPIGDLLSISAAVCWAVYTILLKKVGNRYSSLFITRKVFFYGLLTILPVFFFEPLHTDTSVLLRPVVWGNLLFLGILASLLCYFLWNIIIDRLGAVQATNYVYINPIITLIGSALILGESVTIYAILGAILILLGVGRTQRPFGSGKWKVEN
ncbi:DMT family transporter [Bacteroidales bacterium OttesenSCG-928-L03]|nr:DMT family transporter [Bacteroidales bacterium OttesenSCG-928-L03]